MDDEIPTLSMHVRLRLSALRNRRKRLGLTGQQLAEMADVSATLIYALEGLRHLPWSKSGGWLPSVVRVANALGVEPEDIWPDDLRSVVSPSVEVPIDRHQLRQLVSSGCYAKLPPAPDAACDRQRVIAAVRGALASLGGREREVLQRRLDGETLEQIGASTDVTRERIRQIEGRAMRKLGKLLRAKGLHADIIGDE